MYSPICKTTPKAKIGNKNNIPNNTSKIETDTKINRHLIYKNARAKIAQITRITPSPHIHAKGN